jgi:TPR repeat protein
LNEFRALPYFVRAAKAGDPRAKAILGFYWEHGLALLPPSYAKAEPIYTQAAIAGSALAQARLAFLKMYGRPGVPINQADARTWRKKLSRRGRRALHWLKLAADSGLPSAQFCLASCFYNAIGTRKDDRRAFLFAGRSASQNHPGAQNLLGMLYVDGIPPDVSPDPETGMRWYIRASEQGEAAAIYNIATLFERGVAMDESPSQAFRWYLRAAEYGSISAANIVGLFYEQGVIGEAPDPQKAADWYARAAGQGHPFAQYNVGRCHVEGLGVPTDPAKALGFFERAAQQRHVLARMSLACMWENGIGVSQPDKRRALEWFRRAAYRGSREAQRRLKPVWAARILVASRALLCGGTYPAPGVDIEESGIWALPLELKEGIVGWLNSEVVLSKTEMRGVVRYGRSKETLWGDEMVVEGVPVALSSDMDMEQDELEMMLGKMGKRAVSAREGEEEDGEPTGPDSPGSVHRGELSQKVMVSICASDLSRFFFSRHLIAPSPWFWTWHVGPPLWRKHASPYFQFSRFHFLAPT